MTEADWRQLALEALQSMNLEVARKAFIRIRDVRYVELVNKTEAGKKQVRRGFWGVEGFGRLGAPVRTEAQTYVFPHLFLSLTFSPPFFPSSSHAGSA